MESTAEVPLVGGVADGDTITVELDPHGRPPITHHHLLDGGLAQAEIYELETVAGDGPPWVYRCRASAT
jgi:hypothetical protein